MDSLVKDKLFIKTWIPLYLQNNVIQFILNNMSQFDE